METIQQTLHHTPWWIYLLLAYVIYIGIQASKARIIALKKLFIIPAIFAFMSIHTLITSFAMNALVIATWCIVILIGIVLGWIQVSRFQIKVDKQKKLIQVPGTWSTLIIIIIIFITRYYF